MFNYENAPSILHHATPFSIRVYSVHHCHAMLTPSPRFSVSSLRLFALPLRIRSKLFSNDNFSMIFCNVDQEIIIDENTPMGEYIVIFFYHMEI